MVSTLDFESGDPSSNLGRTSTIFYLLRARCRDKAIDNYIRIYIFLKSKKKRRLERGERHCKKERGVIKMGEFKEREGQ